MPTKRGHAKKKKTAPPTKSISRSKTQPYQLGAPQRKPEQKSRIEKGRVRPKKPTQGRRISPIRLGNFRPTLKAVVLNGKCEPAAGKRGKGGPRWRVKSESEGASDLQFFWDRYLNRQSQKEKGYNP